MICSNPGDRNYTKNEYTTASNAQDCTENDCYFRSIQTGTVSNKYDSATGKCNSDIDCTQILPLCNELEVIKDICDNLENPESCEMCGS